MEKRNAVIFLCLIAMLAAFVISGCARPHSEPIPSTRAIAEEALRKAEAGYGEDSAAMERANEAVRAARECCIDVTEDAEAAEAAAERAERAAARAERIFDTMSEK